MINRFIFKLWESISFLNPERALIFGSFLNKGFEAKDIDILIVSDFFSDCFWQDREKIIHLPFGYNFDTWLYSPTEFENLLPIDNPIRQSIEIFNLDLEAYYGNKKVRRI